MNAAQVDKDGAELAAVIEREVEFEGIFGPITPGKAARIRTMAGQIAGSNWTFSPMVDVARANRIVVTCTAFHGKVEA